MSVSTLTDLLEKQESSANKLHDLLVNELEILTARDLVALADKAAEKEQCLNEINQLDAAIAQIAPMERLKDHPDFQEQVGRIIAVFKDCKHQNEVNGQVINNSQIAINRFKGLLQKSIANNSMTYDQKGQTNINKRSIGIKA